jgi:hypothetical protein
MTRSTTAPAALLAAALLAAAPGGAPAQATSPEKGAPSLKATPPHAGETKCAGCHSTGGWGDVKFIHERTGFPLTGKHAGVACKQCHPAGFDAPVGRSCSACHRDVHGGFSGMHCASCHDTNGWKSLFTADAHRRTNFPLQGKHALIPCESCHGDRRDRAFARPTVDCRTCHAADLARASASGVPHDGFPPNCLDCHSFWRWSPASFSGHDVCFPISGGNHAGIGCVTCHVRLPVPLVISGCNSTPYPICAHCHHTCTSVAGNHGDVSNFSSRCSDQGCYQCHPSGSSGGGDLRLPSLRKGRP